MPQRLRILQTSGGGRSLLTVTQMSVKIPEFFQLYLHYFKRHDSKTQSFYTFSGALPTEPTDFLLLA